MPVPTNTSRPSLPYAPKQSLPNNARFDILTTTQRPPTAEMLDAEFNALTDDVNMLAVAINDVQAGSIPGNDDPNNANKLLKTDGAGNLSWTLITNTEMAPGAVVERGLGLQSVTTPKIGDAAVTPPKIADRAVTSPKIAPHAILPEHLNPEAVTTPAIKDQAIVTAKLADSAVTTPKLAQKVVAQAQIADAAVGTPQLIDANVTTSKLADANVTTPKIADKAVATTKISSAGSNLGDVLTADGANSVSFLPNIGKILQIVNFEMTDTLYDQTPCSPANPVSFSAPFRLTITPKKTGSTIILSYGINIAGGGNSYYGVVLCRNNQIWKVGTSGGEGGFDGGVTHGGYTFSGDASHYGASCFSNIFVDTGTSGQQITYELKKAQEYVTLNRSGYDRQHTISTMLAVEIDI